MICATTGKIKYTRAEAKRVCSRMQRESRAAGRRKKREVPSKQYVCPECGSYHISRGEDAVTKDVGLAVSLAAGAVMMAGWLANALLFEVVGAAVYTLGVAMILRGR